MTQQFAHRLTFVILLLCQLTPCLAAESSNPNDTSKYLDAVRTFADNVLKYGRDSYGPKHTPLFVDGLNVNTHEPVKWIAPQTEAEEWILSNFASQQTLLRTLDGLSAITGDPKYREAAKQAIKYAFENLRAPNGILYWGGVVAYDVLGDVPCGKTGEVLKIDYPYYELMWKADSEVTDKLIGTIWSAHVIDWSNLEIDRFGLWNERLEEPWNHEYKGGSVFFKSKRGWGLTNILTGSSLIQAGATLNELSDQQQPLVWSKRLAKRFVDTRHPNTGISAMTYGGNRWKDDFVRDMQGDSRDPYTTVFPWDFLQAPPRSHFYPENAHAQPWMALFLVGELLGEDGREFTQWALEEFTAWGKFSYRKEDDCFVPMLTDGTSLEGYVWKNGPGQSSGYNKVSLYPADMPFFWAYSIAYGRTGDEFMWQMLKDIALGNGLGDIEQILTPHYERQLDIVCDHPYGVFGFLELYRSTKQHTYLRMACRIADNIVEKRFHKGFFVPTNKHFYTRFDCFEPLALLRLEAVMSSKSDAVPQPWPSLPLFVDGYRHKLQGVDCHVIYGFTESSQPPLSIEEAAAVGDVDLIKRLIEGGVKVEDFSSLSYMTALHRAAMEGHKPAVELLLAKGAPVNERDLDLYTPLTYAVRNNHKEVVELLINNGADVNAKNITFLFSNRGQTPLAIALSQSNTEIVKLLLDKGAKASSIHVAIQVGYQEQAKALLDQGADVNAKDEHGKTALFYAVEHNLKDIVELLIAKGADVNAKDGRGYTPLYPAIWMKKVGIVEVLVTNDADVNLTREKSYPPLNYAVWSEDVNTVKLLVDHGARFNEKDRYGWTAFHYAVQTGNRELVDVFISKGADITTFHMTAAMGDMAGINAFLEQGFAVDAKDEMGNTPLFWAACMGQAEVVKLLIAQGADVNLKVHGQRTALHRAAQLEDGGIVRLLIAQGADVNAKDNEGRTPLLLALHSANWLRPEGKGGKEVLPFLLAHGAQVNIKDNVRGMTPLMVAASQGHADMAIRLINNGADVNAKNKAGQTALDLAREGNHYEIVELLRKHGAKE